MRLLGRLFLKLGSIYMRKLIVNPGKTVCKLFILGGQNLDLSTLNLNSPKRCVDNLITYSRQSLVVYPAFALNIRSYFSLLKRAFYHLSTPPNNKRQFYINIFIIRSLT